MSLGHSIVFSPTRSHPCVALSTQQDAELTFDPLAILADFASRVASLHDSQSVYWAIAKYAVAQMGLEDCVVYSFDKQNHCLQQRAAHGPKSPDYQTIKDPIVIPVSQGIVGTVAATRRSLLIPDTRQDPRYVVDDRFRLSELAVPILYEDKLFGVIDSEHSEPGFFVEQHYHCFKLIAQIAGSRLAYLRTKARMEGATQLAQQCLKEQQRLVSNNLQNFSALHNYSGTWPAQPSRGITTAADASPVAEPVQPMIPNLDEAQFDEAVCDALRHYVEIDRLSSNALINSCLIKKQLSIKALQGRGEEVEALRRIIAQVVADLEECPKTQLYGKVLRATYLRPPRQQTLVAEALNLAQSTYRRHLTRARRLLIAELWYQELQLRNDD